MKRGLKTPNAGHSRNRRSQEPSLCDVIFSVKPKFADKIMDGEKTVELRRRFGRQAVVGARAFIYSSSPAKQMLGYATIRDVHNLSIDKIWKRFGRKAGVTKKQLYTYFDGAEMGYVIALEKPRRFRKAIAMESLRTRFGFCAPQSYRYAGPEYRALTK